LRNESWFSRPLVKFEFGQSFKNFENTNEKRNYGCLVPTNFSQNLLEAAAEEDIQELLKSTA